MRWRNFLGGFALGAVLFGGGMGYLIAEEGEEPVLMPRYHFFDGAKHRLGDDYVSVNGTLVGQNVGRPGNHYDITCHKERGTCDVITFESIDHNHVSGVTHESWRIASWGPDLIVVDSDPDPKEACNRVQLNILRREEKVQYVRIPMNAAAPQCEMVEMKVFRWRLDDPDYWRRADGRE